MGDGSPQDFPRSSAPNLSPPSPILQGYRAQKAQKIQAKVAEKVRHATTIFFYISAACLISAPLSLNRISRPPSQLRSAVVRGEAERRKNVDMLEFLSGFAGMPTFFSP
jgi:hypothetical protein